MLQSVGIDIAYNALEREMVAAGLVSPTWGLHDGSATQLSAWVAERFGIPTGHIQPVDWATVYRHAGELPIGFSGMVWYHWSGVRATDGENLWLANPANGWMGVGQTMTEGQFRSLGPFSAWWIKV